MAIVFPEAGGPNKIIIGVLPSVTFKLVVEDPAPKGVPKSEVIVVSFDFAEIEESSDLRLGLEWGVFDEVPEEGIPEKSKLVSLVGFILLEIIVRLFKSYIKKYKSCHIK